MNHCEWSLPKRVLTFTARAWNSAVQRRPIDKLLMDDAVAEELRDLRRWADDAGTGVVFGTGEMPVETIGKWWFSMVPWDFMGFTLW